jgi:hypothetical protein
MAGCSIFHAKPASGTLSLKFISPLTPFPTLYYYIYKGLCVGWALNPLLFLLLSPPYGALAFRITFPNKATK